jgi:hypothetical protein
MLLPSLRVSLSLSIPRPRGPLPVGNLRGRSMDEDEALFQMQPVYPQIRPSLRPDGHLRGRVQPQVLYPLPLHFPLEYDGDAVRFDPLNERLGDY